MPSRETVLPRWVEADCDDTCLMYVRLAGLDIIGGNWREIGTIRGAGGSSRYDGGKRLGSNKHRNDRSAEDIRKRSRVRFSTARGTSGVWVVPKNVSRIRRTALYAAANFLKSESGFFRADTKSNSITPDSIPYSVNARTRVPSPLPRTKGTPQTTNTTHRLGLTFRLSQRFV